MNDRHKTFYKQAVRLTIKRQLYICHYCHLVFRLGTVPIHSCGLQVYCTMVVGVVWCKCGSYTGEVLGRSTFVLSYAINVLPIALIFSVLSKSFSVTHVNAGELNYVDTHVLIT